MAIDPSELTRRLKGLRDEYIQERVSLILRAADDATALIRLRVIDRRTNAQGGIFGLYADSTWEGGKKDQSISREINFSDTNRMWNGIGGPGDGIKARVVQSDQGKVTVIVQPHDDQNRIEVLGILEDKFGNIVEWSEQEQGLIISIYESKIAELIRKYGF